MDREGKPTKDGEEDDICQPRKGRSRAGLGHMQPVLLEELPLAGGSHGPASPSQHPPDTLAAPSTAQVAVTAGLQGWEDTEVPGLIPAQ